MKYLLSRKTVGGWIEISKLNTLQRLQSYNSFYTSVGAFEALNQSSLIGTVKLLRIFYAHNIVFTTGCAYLHNMFKMQVTFHLILYVQMQLVLINFVRNYATADRF